jgi:prepilin-type processing-associated H-X9-DG protein
LIVDPFEVQYTSYAAHSGPWTTWNIDPNVLQNQRLGLFDWYSAIRLSDITDGTSQTFAFGEKAHGRVTSQREYWHWWWSSDPGDTNVRALTPINFDRKATVAWAKQSAAVYEAGSEHPGGCNFAFVDGSVRFLKETVNTWPSDPATGFPTGVSWDNSNPPRGRVVLTPGVRFGVYQSLSTRNGGEVVSADAY